jgi:hypothetical protein
MHRVSQVVLAFVADAAIALAQDDADPERVGAAREAVVLWLGLAIFCVVILGLGLIWGVTRGAKWAKKKHEPVHTEMPDIWFENPPEQRKQEGP